MPQLELIGEMIAWIALESSFWFFFTGMMTAVSYIKCAYWITRFFGLHYTMFPIVLMLVVAYKPLPEAPKGEVVNNSAIDGGAKNETTTTNNEIEPKTTETKPE